MKKMKPWQRVFLVCSVLFGAEALALSPADFRVRVPLEISGGATWYRVDVGMDLWWQAAKADFGDLRVFNTDGEEVPYAVTLSHEESTETERKIDVPRFPLTAPSESADPPAEVRIRADASGALVEIAPRKAGQPNGVARGWLLDVSAVDEPLTALELAWEGGADGFQEFEIETSNDLRHWSSCCVGQLARLAFNGERIDQRRVDLPRLRARYLRLIWTEPRQAPTIGSAQVTVSHNEWVAAPLVWSEPIAANFTAANEWIWTLPIAMPVERIRLAELPVNTLLPIQVMGWSDSKPYWSELSQSLLYHLQVKGKARSQLESVLPARPIKQLKLKIDPRGGGLGGVAARLSFGATANQVVFLARGYPPFTLAIGNPRLISAALPLATLIPGGVVPDTSVIGSAKYLYAPAATQTSDASKPTAGAPSDTEATRRYALWGVLLAGVGLLGYMAWQLVAKSRDANF